MAKAALRIPGVFYDDDFTDPALRDVWVTGKDLAPDYYEEVGLLAGGGIGITDPKTRPGTYEPEVDPWLAPHPPEDGMIYPAISWAGRRAPTPDVEITWSGLWSEHAGHHIECAPLLWIDPTNPLGGFGAWPSALGTTPESDGGQVAFIGFIGSPPELFNEPAVPVVGSFGFAAEHTDGVPMTLRVACVDDVISIWFGGVLKWTRPLTDPIFAPVAANFAALRASDLHGFAIDAHFVRPVSSVPTHQQVLDVRYRY